MNAATHAFAKDWKGFAAVNQAKDDFKFPKIAHQVGFPGSVVSSLAYSFWRSRSMLA